MKRKLMSLALALALCLSVCGNAYAAYGLRPFSGNRLQLKKGHDQWEEVAIRNEQGGIDWVQGEDSLWERTYDLPDKAAVEKRADSIRKELESRYDVKITDDYKKHLEDGDAQYMLLRMMESLREEFQYIPEPLLTAVRKQLAAGKQKLSIKLSMANGVYFSGDKASGTYDPKSNTICLYDTASLCHEYGHMLHFKFLDKKYGAANLQSMWTAKNGGAAYNAEYDYENSTFVTAYASTSYREDVPETFAYLLNESHAGRDILENHAGSVAAQKVAYMRALLCETFSLDPSVFPPLAPVQPSGWAAADMAEYEKQFGLRHWYYFSKFQPNAYQAGISRYNFARSAYELAVAYWREVDGAHRENWPGYPNLSEAELKKEDPFTDVDYNPQLVNLYLMKVIADDGGKFNPNRQITRQEAAAMLYRLCVALGYQFPESSGVAFADSGDIADWAEDSVKAVSAAGIMGSTDKNRFDPNAVYSYEQTAATMLRVQRLLLS